MTFAHQALVASGSALASSVWVIQPYRPDAGEWLSDDVVSDFLPLEADDGVRFFAAAFFVAPEREPARRAVAALFDADFPARDGLRADFFDDLDGFFAMVVWG